ncbi:hypothetical protein [Kluyvera cryocrescens]|nr:hypothetical protein [Kluyvera cryocrescens]
MDNQNMIDLAIAYAPHSEHIIGLICFWIKLQTSISIIRMLN